MKTPKKLLKDEIERDSIGYQKVVQWFQERFYKHLQEKEITSSGGTFTIGDIREVINQTDNYFSIDIIRDICIAYADKYDWNLKVDISLSEFGDKPITFNFFPKYHQKRSNPFGLDLDEDKKHPFD